MSIYGPLWRKVARAQRRFLRFPAEEQSELPLSVIIPLIAKDLATVNHCIRGLRQNLLHPVTGIYLVGPALPEIINCAKNLDCTYVDEREILPEGPEYYARYFREDEKSRSNWMYQQFLKLSVGERLGLSDYLTVDADTVLINPFKYEIAGKRIFDVSDGYRSDLQISMNKLLPRFIWKGFSFMCHVMLFQQSMVERLLTNIENLTGREWKSGIFDSIDLRDHVCFSEFELYANFCLQQNRANYRLSYWFNKNMLYLPEDSFETLCQKYGSRFRTLSFHAYNIRANSHLRGM